MVRTFSYNEHHTSNFVKVLVIALLVTNSLGAPLLLSGKATAISPSSAVCQEGSNTSINTLAAPTLLTPSNDGTNANGFDFSWSSVNGASQYDWESSLDPDLNPDGSFKNVLGHHRLEATSINEGNSPWATYFWHVRAVASDGTTGSWSQIWKVTIDSSHPSYLNAPTLVTPSDGAICNIYSEDFYFIWNAPTTDGGAGPLTYDFQSGRSEATDPVNGDFIDQPWTDTGITTTSIFDGGSPSATYFWHVRAVASNGMVGPWSAAWAVTIKHDAPPVEPPVVPITPIENTPAIPVIGQTINHTETTTSSSVRTVPNVGIASVTDIATILSTNIGAGTSQATALDNDNKTHNKSTLAANISAVNGNLFTRNIIWIFALVLSLSAAIFAYQRRQTSKK